MSKSTQIRSHQIELVELSKLKPYKANPRAHSRRQINSIAASIREFGFTNPVLIDDADVLIAGHGRTEAATLLKMASVPAYRLVGLSEAQKRALRIADNRIAEQSTWTADLLAGELQFLVDSDFSIELTGFDTIDLDKFLTPIAETASHEDEPMPEPPERPISRLGDLWQLGNHRVICGSALDPAVLRELLGGEIVDLVLTDPPYNVPIPGHVSGAGRTRHQNFVMASGEMSTGQFEAFLSTVLKNARDVSRDGSLHYVFMDWRSIQHLLAVGDRLYDKLMNLCVWAKSNAGMGSLYRSQHELVAVFKYGKSAHVNNVQLGRLGRNRSNVWQYAGANSFSGTRDADLADHPTVKPTALLVDVIRDATAPGNLVFDPFGGSGSTLLAAQATNRRAALIEIEPRFVDVILTRFAKRSGIEPTLQPFQIPLSRVRASRLEGENDHVEQQR